MAMLGRGLYTATLLVPRWRLELTGVLLSPHGSASVFGESEIAKVRL